MKFSRYTLWTDDGEPPAVFSGLSGSLLPVSPGERDELEQFVRTGATSLPESRLEEFIHHRVLVSSAHDEREVLRNRFNRSKYDSSNLELTLVTSLGCNFDCPYCYESKRPSIMNAEVQQAVLALIDDGKDRLKNLSVTWMGGEPLVGRDSLFALSEEIIRRCDEYGIEYRCDIITNGWLLNAEVAQRLVDYRCDGAQVTIDGPPDVHNEMRPYVGGGATFDRIVENLQAVADILPISVRVNIDESNLWRCEELFALLAEAGLSERIFVYPGKMTYYDDNADAPVTTYTSRCYSTSEFAQVELEFQSLARRFGFSQFDAPDARGVPCTAVSATGLIVGSEGEVWKCWDDIGNSAQMIGDIRDYRNLASELLLPWLQFNPVDDPQCGECVALPNCMGGCLRHTLHGAPRDEQCGTFRFNHRERVHRAARELMGVEQDEIDYVFIDASAEVNRGRDTNVASSVPVQLTRRDATPLISA